MSKRINALWAQVDATIAKMDRAELFVNVTFLRERIDPARPMSTCMIITRCEQRAKQLGAVICRDGSWVL